jgi:adenine-specific DNA-methyltransferase
MGFEDRDEASKLSQKEAGAYYTPDPVVSSLVAWAVRGPEDRLIDPSCGDGRFIASHRNAVGIEQDTDATRLGGP